MESPFFSQNPQRHTQSLQSFFENWSDDCKSSDQHLRCHSIKVENLIYYKKISSLNTYYSLLKYKKNAAEEFDFLKYTAIALKSTKGRQYAFALILEAVDVRNETSNCLVVQKKLLLLLASKVR